MLHVFLCLVKINEEIHYWVLVLQDIKNPEKNRKLEKCGGK